MSGGRISCVSPCEKHTCPFPEIPVYRVRNVQLLYTEFYVLQNRGVSTTNEENQYVCTTQTRINFLVMGVHRAILH